MRLNLGCGRAQFPTTPDNPYTAHQAPYLERFVPSAFDAEAGWANVDSAPIDGVGKVMDLFTYPWDFADNSVDEIFCSHIVEHIPHVAEVVHTTEIVLGGMLYGRVRDVPSPELRRAAKLDGWYAFFYEVWRVLKPGGVVHIIAPYAWSSAGVLDPTHTRMVAPGSFSYFVPNPDAPFDYQIPARFEQTTNQLTFTPLGAQILDEYGMERGIVVAMRTIDAVTEFYMGLKAVK